MRPGTLPGLIRFSVRRPGPVTWAALAVPFAATLMFLVLLVLAPSVMAHGSQTLVVEPPVAEPGTNLSIHGDYLWTDMEVVITLSGPTAPGDPIGTAVTDGTGHLEATATLPEVRPGNYEVVVTAASGETVSTGLVVPSPAVVLPIAIGFGLLALVVVGFGAWTRRRHAPGAVPEP